jgi:hypothetical protein
MVVTIKIGTAAVSHDPSSLRGAEKYGPACPASTRARRFFLDILPRNESLATRGTRSAQRRTRTPPDRPEPRQRRTKNKTGGSDGEAHDPGLESRERSAGYWYGAFTRYRRKHCQTLSHGGVDTSTKAGITNSFRLLRLRLPQVHSREGRRRHISGAPAGRTDAFWGLPSDRAFENEDAKSY